MGKMVTVEKKAVGTYDWPDKPGLQARIERNVFAYKGETSNSSWTGEALRFCKSRNGRHNRVHLVIGEDEFVDLFRDAVKNGVFHAETLEQLRAILGERGDPFLEVIGIGQDGKLSQNIDAELYGERQG